MNNSPPPTSDNYQVVSNMSGEERTQKTIEEKCYQLKKFKMYRIIGYRRRKNPYISVFLDNKFQITMHQSMNCDYTLFFDECIDYKLYLCYVVGRDQF